MNKSEVLRQRTFTGIIFSLVVVFLILSGKYGAASLGLIISWVGAAEYTNMVYPNKKSKKVESLLYVSVVIAILFFTQPDTILYFIVLVLSLLAIIVFIIHIFTPLINFKKNFLLILILYLGLPLGLFISFVLNSEIYCYLFWLVVMGLIWLTDSMAYLVGSRIGKTKLYERISPKKTWEGFLGAGLITIPLAWCAGYLFLHDSSSFYFISEWCVQNSGLFVALLGFVVWIIGTLGDLFESCLKRFFNVKDSGHFMPGHGGMLDRFDSFIFILPFILLLLQIL